MSNPKMGPQRNDHRTRVVDETVPEGSEEAHILIAQGRTPHRSGLQDPAETLARFRETGVILSLWLDAVHKIAEAQRLSREWLEAHPSSGN